MPGQIAPYDVFFCYSWKDKSEADGLVEALKQEWLGNRHLSVFQDNKEMDDFDLITPEVNEALANSHCLVVLYSRNMLASSYCRFEMRFALSAAHALDGTPQRVMAIPRGIEYEELRPSCLGDLRLPNPWTASRDNLVASIVARVEQTDHRVLGDAPRPPEPRWFPSPLAGTRSFVGRDIELWEVHDAVHGYRDPSVGGASVARIVGLGGQGKTMLAEQYARQFAADYPGGIFVLRGFGSHNADRAGRHHVRTRRADQVAGFVRHLELDADGLDSAGIDQVFRTHMEGVNAPYLWIIDDLPAALDHETFTTLLAPTANGHTLITTRYSPADLGSPWGEEVRLGGLDGGASFRLLTARRQPRDDPNDAERRAAHSLTERLGRYPLALAVAAGLVARRDEEGFAWLLAAVDSPGPDVLELGERLWGELPTGHRASIATTMLRSIDRLGDIGRDVLRAASLLAATPIPGPLVDAMLAHADQNGIRNRNQVSEAGVSTVGFEEATSRSLAESIPEVAVPSWVVHSMVSRSLRFVDLDDDRRGRLRAGAVQALTTLLESSRSTFTHRELVDYLPHVGEVAQALLGEDERHLLNESGRVHVEIGDLRAALARYKPLYRACLAGLGAEHQTTLVVLAGLGVVHGMLGEHAIALDYKRKAYEGLAGALGHDDPNVLVAYNNVAVTYSDLGKEQAARTIYAEVYRARRRLLNVQHPSTLEALGNYAISTGRCGNQRLALRLKQHVYQRSRAIHGEEHPATLDALNNVAASTAALGDRPTAHDLFLRVHEGQRRCLGDDHIDTLTTLENVAVTSTSQAAAAAELLTVYLCRIQALGPAHPAVLRVLRWHLECAQPRQVVDKAHLVCAPNDENANGMIATALAIALQETRVRSLGPDAPDTLMATCCLAHGLATQGSNLGSRELIDDAVEGLDTNASRDELAVRAMRVLQAWIHAAQ